MEQFGKNKTILLAMPEGFLYQELRQQLEKYGFNTIGLPFADGFRYKNLKDRAYNLIRKTFFNDRSYKSHLQFIQQKERIYAQLDQVNVWIDYALIIRPDIYSRDVIQKIKAKTTCLVGYQWDGLKRFPEVLERIPEFDRFFVFDPDDLTADSVLPATNFYLPIEKEQNVNVDLAVFYLGTLIKPRLHRLHRLTNYLDRQGIRSTVKIYTKKKAAKKYTHFGFDISNRFLSYKENLQHVGRSEVLVDLVHEVHSGLSFRVFEALGNDKKLITDNKTILKYDFYHPHNIYLMEGEDFDGLKEFLALPYHPLDKEIKDKYSFENWIKYVLDIPPYQAISLFS